MSVSELDQWSCSASVVSISLCGMDGKVESPGNSGKVKYQWRDGNSSMFSESDYSGDRK